ncbi:AMT1-1, partial [Symbiodinium sp. CCMP2456]
MHFPDEGAGGKCNKEFWSKWIPRRIKHNAFVLSLWACVWLLGTYPLGRPLSEGWRFMFTVSVFARIGYSAAWMFITNFTHSLPWNEFLAQDPGRTWPVLHNVMAMVLGGKHRWNEMLFHDVHHAFPNAVGTLSQRGRFHGWEKVHDAAAEVLHRGLWKPNGDEETQMQKTQCRGGGSEWLSLFWAAKSTEKFPPPVDYNRLWIRSDSPLNQNRSAG